MGEYILLCLMGLHSLKFFPIHLLMYFLYSPVHELARSLFCGRKTSKIAVRNYAIEPFCAN